MQPVQATEIPTIATTLAKAFADDPVFALMFGQAAPEPRATRFFEIMATVQMPHGLVFRTAGNEAAAIWAPPDEWRVSPLKIARYTPAFFKIFGPRFISNLGVLNRLEKNHPTEPHYYLEFIGTAPAHQGKGMGSDLMQPLMDRCDTEGVGAYLESSKEDNLAFYGRFGFEVTKVITHKAGKGKPAVPQWLMWRDPK